MTIRPATHGTLPRPGNPAAPGEMADPAARLDWARGILASPAHATCDAEIAEACRIMAELSDDAEVRKGAARLLTLIEGETA